MRTGLRATETPADLGDRAKQIQPRWIIRICGIRADILVEINPRRKPQRVFTNEPPDAPLSRLF